LDAWPALVSVADWQLFLLRLLLFLAMLVVLPGGGGGGGAAASHVLTVINLTGINEIYMSNTFCDTLTDRRMSARHWGRAFCRIYFGNWIWTFDIRHLQKHSLCEFSNCKLLPP